MSTEKRERLQQSINEFKLQIQHIATLEAELKQLLAGKENR